LFSPSVFSLHVHAVPRDLHSFPTRRSSDLASAVSADQLRLTLENVRAAFDLNYAFFDWKKENRQWDVDHRLARIRARIDAGDYTDRKSTRLNSSHVKISYAVFCLKKKKRQL